MNYCSRCGAALVETQRLNHYDSQWGTPRYLFTRTCPNRRWFNGHHTKASLVARDAAEADRAEEWAWHSGWE